MHDHQQISENAIASRMGLPPGGHPGAAWELVRTCDTNRAPDHFYLFAMLLTAGCACLALSRSAESMLLPGAALGALGVLGACLWCPDLLVLVAVAGAVDLFGLLPAMNAEKVSSVLSVAPARVLLALGIMATLLCHRRTQDSAARVLTRRSLILLSYFASLVLLNFLAADSQQITDAIHVAGANFAYYVCFWMAVTTIQSRTQILRAVGFIRVGAAIVALLSILSNLAQRPIVPGLGINYENAPFLRVYSLSYCFCIFVVLLGLAFRLRPGSVLRIGLFEIVLNVVGFLLFLTRGWTFVFALMLLACCLVLGVGRRLLILISCLMLAGFLAALMVSPTYFAPIQRVFLHRAKSAGSEVRNVEGNWGARVEMMRHGFALFRDSPLFGLKMRRGYFNMSSLEEKQPTINADTGYTSLLFTTGACGFALVTWFFVGALRRLWQTHKFGLTITGRNLALAAFILVAFDYFITQIEANFFASNMVAPYLLILAIGIKADRILTGTKATRMVET